MAPTKDTLPRVTAYQTISADSEVPSSEIAQMSAPRNRFFFMVCRPIFCPACAMLSTEYPKKPSRIERQLIIQQTT